jgi:hypothetical protein
VRVADTLLTINNLAEKVGAAPQTLYNWQAAGLIAPAFVVATANDRQMPVFTMAQRAEVAELVRTRKAARARYRLAPSGS